MYYTFHVFFVKDIIVVSPDKWMQQIEICALNGFKGLSSLNCDTVKVWNKWLNMFYVTIC